MCDKNTKNGNTFFIMDFWQRCTQIYIFCTCNHKNIQYKRLHIMQNTTQTIMKSIRWYEIEPFDLLTSYGICRLNIQRVEHSNT